MVNQNTYNMIEILLLIIWLTLSICSPLFLDFFLLTWWFEFSMNSGLGPEFDNKSSGILFLRYSLSAVYFTLYPMIRTEIDPETASPTATTTKPRHWRNKENPFCLQILFLGFALELKFAVNSAHLLSSSIIFSIPIVVKFLYSFSHKFNFVTSLTQIATHNTIFLYL